MTTSDTRLDPAPIPAEQIRVPDSRVLRFEGEGHGSSFSFFLVTCDPGKGPRLHRHPYDETFHVLEGEARLVAGDVELRCILGHRDRARTVLAPVRGDGRGDPAHPVHPRLARDDPGVPRGGMRGPSRTTHLHAPHSHEEMFR